MRYDILPMDPSRDLITIRERYDGSTATCDCNQAGEPLAMSDEIRRESVVRIVSIVLRVLVGLMFLSSAVMKFAGDASTYQDLNVARWLWQVTGVLEAIGVLALLGSFWNPRLAVAGGIWFVGIMLGALVVHIRAGDPVLAMIFPGLLLILSAVIAAIAYREVEAREETFDRSTSIPTS